MKTGVSPRIGNGYTFLVGLSQFVLYQQEYFMISKTMWGPGLIFIFCALFVLSTGCGESTPDRSTSEKVNTTTQTTKPAPQNIVEEKAVAKPAVPATVPGNELTQTAKKNEPPTATVPELPVGTVAPQAPAIEWADPGPTISPAVVADLEKVLGDFRMICVSINELAMDMDIVRDEVSAGLKQFRKLCSDNQVQPVLEYHPCFETTQAKFLVRSRGPWQWAFGVKHGQKASRDYILLDMSGESPVFSVTKEGQLAFPETAMIPLGTLSWSAEDAGQRKVCKSISSQFIKPGRVTASVAFPSGDCPQFLDKMFDINLIASTGQLQFLPGNELYFQPVGKEPVRVPLFEYYQKKREEKEKKRGSAFETNARPSPIKDAIGMIVYTEIVNHQLAKSGITERNDTGFDFYIENADKVKLMLYTARQ